MENLTVTCLCHQVLANSVRIVKFSSVQLHHPAELRAASVPPYRLAFVNEVMNVANTGTHYVMPRFGYQKLECTRCNRWIGLKIVEEEGDFTVNKLAFFVGATVGPAVVDVYPEPRG